MPSQPPSTDATPSATTGGSERPSAAPGSPGDAAAPTAKAAARNDSVANSSVPVPVPEKPQSLWRRLAMRSGRRPILGTIDEQLELIRTRIEVVEEQLRSLGGALGRTVDRVGLRIDEATQTSNRTLDAKLDAALGRIDEHLDGALAGIDRKLVAPFARIDEQLDAIGAALRSDLGALNTQFTTRVDALTDSVNRTQRETAETAREDRERLESRLTELWEVGDQLTQIEELVEHMTETRDEMSALGTRVQALSWSVTGLGAVLVLGAIGFAALHFGWIAI